MARTFFDKFAPRLLKSLSDEQYTRINYLWHYRRPLRLNAPATLNEQILWLMLYNRDPLVAHCTDKSTVGEYVRTVVSAEILAPRFGVYERAEDVPYDSLPDQFILKATHGSGWNIICRSRSTFDRDAATARLSKYLRTNYYDFRREWAYKEIKPRILCEQLLLDSHGNIPIDYKFFYFHGEPRIVEVDYARFTAHTRNLYDTHWRLIPCQYRSPNNPAAEASPPEALPELLAISRRLSSAFPFVRVDLYLVGARIFFGELTFYPGGGFSRFHPSSFDRLFGSYLNMRAVRPYGT